ncbi:hypothetical protein PHYSODRAFT_251307 [Phytophthora sojae]|uniref:Uncharacterized protein n=1 Tax=Phytophthora sojae (strain P6497) TaxID=1094619 RepID=G4ZB62_PHYSP|nr:hypothetical protein PHYSODRAFT_251307 [Phytophthora sojae]EGZ22028.1 hypothetical protein PHYSODRAFT_251307 [Phytophthora sojae]|eukprot:XP_009524745.1 hypothetical protein PHYSODRAFT_251307 [Phytophthora sojae]
MNLSTEFTLAALAVASVANANTLDHDKVQPFPHPDPSRSLRRPQSSSSPSSARTMDVSRILLCTTALGGTETCGPSCTLGISPRIVTAMTGRVSSCGSTTLPPRHPRCWGCQRDGSNTPLTQVHGWHEFHAVASCTR